MARLRNDCTGDEVTLDQVERITIWSSLLVAVQLPYTGADYRKIVGSAGAARGLRKCRLETRHDVAPVLRQLRWRPTVLFLPAGIGAGGKQRLEHCPYGRAIFHFRHIMQRRIAVVSGTFGFAPASKSMVTISVCWRDTAQCSAVSPSSVSSSSAPALIKAAIFPGRCA